MTRLAQQLALITIADKGAEASFCARSSSTPEPLAVATLFFASPRSHAVTGQNLIVDGGLVRD
ncbi:MAG: SDR family oxidoreductase [Stenotrophomonas sp.]|uniref:SDR family oxidoreductase n=1 Tax=Stenotrophomonas sp. TaxID=69392 RepID=UPI003D6CB436